EDHHAAAKHEHDAQEREGFGFYVRCGINEIEQKRRDHIADWGHDPERDRDCGEERLIDCAVNLFFVAGADKTSDEHAHAREKRSDEDYDDQKYLPGHADCGVSLITDKIANQSVVNHSLQSADSISQHRWPCDFPDRTSEWPFYDGSVIA